MLCLANIKGEGLVCYDGNHRRCMFERLYELGDEFDCEVIIDIMFDVTQEQVYTAFENVNKSIQVPAIYLDDDLSKVKDDIIKLVDSYVLRYKAFVSSSSKCHRPSFNRDTFIEDVSNIFIYFKKGKDPLSIEDIRNLLTKLNVYYGKQQLNYDHSTLTETSLKKCKKHDFWLFGHERNISINHLEKIRKLELRKNKAKK